MKTFSTLIFLACLTSTLCLAGEDIIYKSYSVRNPRMEVLEALQQVVGSRGKVIDDRASGKLMVLATSNAHVQVSAMLADLDVPIRNVRVDVTTRQSVRQTEQGVDIQARGSVVASGQGANFRIKVNPRVVDESSAANSVVEQSLVIIDGGEGSLSVAQEVPHFEWLWEYGQASGCVPRDAVMQQAGAFLTVQAKIIGDGHVIRLKLVPELRGLVNKKSVRLQYTKMATEVTVGNGASLQIGGFGEDQEFSRKFLVGFNRGGQAQSLVVTVSPHVLGPDGHEAAR